MAKQEIEPKKPTHSRHDREILQYNDEQPIQDKLGFEPAPVEHLIVGVVDHEIALDGRGILINTGDFRIDDEETVESEDKD